MRFSNYNGFTHCFIFNIFELFKNEFVSPISHYAAEADSYISVKSENIFYHLQGGVLGEYVLTHSHNTDRKKE